MNYYRHLAYAEVNSAGQENAGKLHLRVGNVSHRRQEEPLYGEIRCCINVTPPHRQARSRCRVAPKGDSNAVHTPQKTTRLTVLLPVCINGKAVYWSITS